MIIIDRTKFFFFEASRESSRNITDIFDFLWPTATAMWNLRWQVNGFLSVCPDALPNVLTNRFVHGSDIHGANLKRAYVESSWEEQKEKLAGFLLVNVIALYESYLSCLHDQLASCNDTKSAFDLRKATENLQFPTDTANKKGGGIWKAIETIRTRESEMLKNAFYDGLLKNKGTSEQELIQRPTVEP